MFDYTEFKVEAEYNHTKFKVLVKGWFGIWKSGFIYTDYFSINYTTEEDALEAIRLYKARFTIAQ